MDLTISKKDFIIFDLDDTLYKEIDYLKSAYRFIAKRLESEIGHNIYQEMLVLREKDKVVLDVIHKKYLIQRYTIQDLVYLYRFHQPDLHLNKEVEKVLQYLKKKDILMGIITDGRSRSQRNKLAALGISDLFMEILISEEFGSSKPNPHNFLYYEATYPNHQFTYIGDNYKKDFIVPNRLAWRTIGLKDDGRNIHPQDETLDVLYLPQSFISSFEDIKVLDKKTSKHDNNTNRQPNTFCKPLERKRISDPRNSR